MTAEQRVAWGLADLVVRFRDEQGVPVAESLRHLAETGERPPLLGLMTAAASRRWGPAPARALAAEWARLFTPTAAERRGLEVLGVPC